jgi:ribosomal protein S18 acetylase RimI-like enzyme
LEELYVVPDYRRLGYGRMLVESMTFAAQKAGCVKMDWVCLQGNQRALHFYEKLGATRMEDWAVLKTDKKAMEGLAADRKWIWV